MMAITLYITAPALWQEGSACRVMVNVATAPISGRNPAMMNALSKLPVICTT